MSEKMAPYCLIDCDPIKYSAGFAIEKKNKETGFIEIEPVAFAFSYIDNMIKKCIDRCETEQFKCFVTPLGDKTNFRFKIFPDYKANRKDIRKPLYLKELHQYLVTRWNAIESVGEEADDTMSIFHCSLHPFGHSDKEYNSVLCSIDKDFNNIPGWHYKPNKDEFYYVTETDALRNFYLQILTGDKADNIPRLKKGWRQKEAEQLLLQTDKECDMIDIVLNTIKKERPTLDAYQYMLGAGRLVWLRQQEYQIWEPKSEQSQSTNKS